jgi:hypothetical protein
MSPVVDVFSDQNFVPSLSCSNGECINIVRVENESILELADIAQEMFGSVTFPEGSILMFGSGSHLGRSGTSIYARDWSEVVALSTDRWHGIRVCPLIPLLVSECPGTIVREIGEFAIWLESVYDMSPQGLHNVWRGLVAAMENFSTGATTLDTVETYKLVLPSTLHARLLDRPMTFCSNNSRPMTFNGLSKDSCSELLGLMLANIHEKFRACSRP